MRTIKRIFLVLVASALLSPSPGFAQSLSFKEIEAQVSEYKQWLDQLGSKGSRLWLKLDSAKRPHRLYVGEGFTNADYQQKERLIDVFSRFLARHPKKHMLIDIYDSTTGKVIGEYGFGGFKLYEAGHVLQSSQPLR